MVKPNLFVVRRSDLRAVNSILENGKEVDLGELRDFRKHPEIASFLPNVVNPSMAWTKLAQAQRLEVHKHPTKSMVVVAEGRGYLTGDVETTLEAGDVVCIYPGANHGFVAGDSDLHCLSLQFEGSGLYENENTPRVQFTESVYDEFVALNEKYCERFRTLVIEDVNVVMSNARCQEAFWSQLKRWSTTFQHLLFVRQISTSVDDPLYDLFRGHLREEFDHDQMVDAPPAPWDSVLDACAAWFERTIANSPPVEKLIIVNLALEGAGDVFSTELRGHFERLGDYIETHHDHDEDHANLGQEHLQAHVEYNYEMARSTLTQAWEVFFLMFERIIELSKQSYDIEH